MIAILPGSLLIAGAVQISCQIVKFVTHSWGLRRLSWKHLVTFGGMPSAHSAFVTAIGVAVGISSGFTSDLFAIATVFGLIVILDAYKLRGNVQKQAIVVNRLQNALPEGDRISINEMVGHSIGEILAGVAVALAVATPLSLVFLRSV